MTNYTAIFTFGLLMTLTAVPSAFASSAQASTQPPETSTLYRGSGR